MKSAILRKYFSEIAVVALTLGFASSGRADIVIEQVGPPAITGSWTVQFFANGGSFDTITGTVSSPIFEIPGLTAPGWTSTPSSPVGGGATTATISDGTVNSLLFDATFLNTPSTTAPFILDFAIFNQGALVGQVGLEWTGSEFDVVVPEPTTIIAGALLLVPFGVSTLRVLRKTRAA
jgi:hypothetical protein